MTDNFGTIPVQDYGTPIPPVEEPPKKSNNTVLIIVIVVLIVLCCCCVLAGGAGFYLWNNGDQIFGTGLNIPLWLLSA